MLFVVFRSIATHPVLLFAPASLDFAHRRNRCSTTPSIPVKLGNPFMCFNIIWCFLTTDFPDPQPPLLRLVLLTSSDVPFLITT